MREKVGKYVMERLKTGKGTGSRVLWGREIRTERHKVWTEMLSADRKITDFLPGRRCEIKGPRFVSLGRGGGLTGIIHSKEHLHPLIFF